MVLHSVSNWRIYETGLKLDRLQSAEKKHDAYAQLVPCRHLQLPDLNIVSGGHLAQSRAAHAWKRQ